MTDVDKRIMDLVSVVSKYKPGSPLKSYISHSRLYNFKGLEKGATISFDFPFTAIVGANGVGKSSILHALYGMPDGKSTAVFWFSTDLDPIQSIVRDPPRYVYGHWHETYKGIVETRKARVFRKSRNYEYWEPTKIAIGDKMEPMPQKDYPRKDADRWNAVEREVVYLNMRRIAGAFDRAFSYGLPLDKVSEKHNEMRSGAKRIKSVIKRNADTWRLGGGDERVFENRKLSAEETKYISSILGREYDSADYIRHSLYSGQKSEDVSVVFYRGITYSEAFAGSGEVSIVEIVVSVLKASKYALILIDEPETSLHPGAQRELLCFLLGQVKEKHLQIVISTHSMEFLSGLPDESIKVVDSNGEGKSRILNKCSPYVALNRLGKAHASKIIYVEDPMAKAVIEYAVESMDPGEKSAFEVRVTPGGADDILVRQIPGYILSEHDCFVFLDGDKKKADNFIDPDTIPVSENDTLEEIIVQEVGVVPKFSLNGGRDKSGNAEAKKKCQRDYLRWVKERLNYLPMLCPEALILTKCESVTSAELATSGAAKKAFRRLVSQGTSSSEELGIAKFLLKKVSQDDEDLVFIRETIKQWL